MISQVFGFLLAMYFLAGRWSIDRLDGGFDDDALFQQPRVWVVAMFVAWAALAINGHARKRVGKALTSVDAAICLFLGYMLFAALWSPSAELAIDKAIEIGLLLTVAVAFAISRPVFDQAKVGDGFWWTMVLVGVAMGAFAVACSSGGRLAVPGGGPNTFGRNMGLMALGGMHLAGRYGAKLNPVAAVLMIVALLLIILCGSRGALLSTSVALLVMFVAGKVTFIKKFAIAVMLGFGGAAFLFCTAMGQDALEIFQARIVDATIHDRYLSARDNLWQDAIDWAAERPIFGWGLNGYRANSWTYPHNMFLEVMVEGGGVGLLLLLSVAAAWLSQVRKSRFQFPRVSVAALAFVFTAAQTSGDLFDSRGVFLMLALTAPVMTAATRRTIPVRLAVGQFAVARATPRIAEF